MDGVIGVVEQILVRPAARLACQQRARVTARLGSGIDGDHAGRGKREVTLLDTNAWDAACAELGVALPPSARRANLVLRGVDLAATNGRVLEVGDAVLQITGEARPCELLDDEHLGLNAVLRRDWRGGVCARVLQGGAIATGDAVRWSSGEARTTRP